jgi:hypothetical protein
MDSQVQAFVDSLENAVNRDDFLEYAYDIIEELSELDGANEAIEPILKIMEKHPNIDYGKPGPLVHFLESYYKNGYEEILIDSLKRCPTMHTVWMLNRIINGSQGESLIHYKSFMGNLLITPNIDKDVLDLVKHFTENNH